MTGHPGIAGPVLQPGVHIHPGFRVAVQMLAGTGAAVYRFSTGLIFLVQAMHIATRSRPQEGKGLAHGGGDHPLKRGFPMKITLKDQIMGADAPIPHV